MLVSLPFSEDVAAGPQTRRAKASVVSLVYADKRQASHLHIIQVQKNLQESENTRLQQQVTQLKALSA